MPTPEKAPLVPSVTGNPATDSIIRNCIVATSAAAAGVMVTWLNAHGFNDPNLSLMISGAIAAVLSAAAAALWGWWAAHMSQAAIVNNTVRAALTQEVPAAIMAKATETQARAVEENPNTTVVPTPPASPKAL